MEELVTRREFLERIAVGTAVASISTAAAEASPARPAPPSEKVTLGLIGCGGRGMTLMSLLQSTGQAQFAAVCDPDTNRMYAAQKQAGEKARAYKDFRQLLEQKDIDAVVIATPDHWHAIPTIRACEAGKDVYVEKPLAHNIFEGLAMIQAKNRYNRIVAFGTQQRSGAHFQRAVEIVRSGQLGKITRCQTWNLWNESEGAKGTGRGTGIGNPPDGPVPPGVDYDLWLGPAPKRPFNPNRFHFNYIYFWDYAGGMMTGWAVHLIDIVHWAMGVEAPETVYCTGGKFALTDNRETPDTQEALCTYPGWIGIYSVHHANKYPICGRDYGIAFYGTKGTLILDRSGFEIVPEGERMQAARSGGSDQDGAHVRKFIECVKTRKQPAATLEDGFSATLPCWLANISLRLGGRLIKWDAKAKTIVGDPEAKKMMRRTYRKPWTL